MDYDGCFISFDLDDGVMDEWFNTFSPKYREHARYYVKTVLPCTRGTKHEDVEMTNIIADHFHAFLRLYCLDKYDGRVPSFVSVLTSS